MTNPTKPAPLPTSIDIGPFRYTITIDELTRATTKVATKKSAYLVAE